MSSSRIPVTRSVVAVEQVQGDVRAAALMWLTGARWRVGYANSGGGYLLTHVVPLDESGAITDDFRIRAALPTIDAWARCDAPNASLT